MQGSTVGAALCNTSFGQDKSGIRWSYDSMIIPLFTALGAQSEGCSPSCLPHMCHVLAFSVSPAGAGLCSCQLAAFEVHHRQVGTKTASNQWHFRFEAHLFDHTDPLLFSQDHADAHVEAKLAEIAFHRATVES